jgi:hypothetical protein
MAGVGVIARCSSGMLYEILGLTRVVAANGIGHRSQQDAKGLS